jgi:hypothetical protein
MRKFILFLLGVVMFITAVFVAAPVLAGVAISGTLLFKGIKLVATETGIPAWLEVLLFVTLVPSLLWWSFQVFTAKARRRMVVILIAVGILYALVTAVTGNQHLAAAAQNAAVSINKLLAPIESADPTTATWFNPDGSPHLFYVHPSTNVWQFYKGAYLAGTHDPTTGAGLQPVTTQIRDMWQTEREREAAKQEQTERLALAVQRQQLDNLSDSIHRQKAALEHNRQSVLAKLWQRLEEKELEFTGTEAKLPDSPLQTVNRASQNIARVRAKLAAALTNDTDFDVPAIGEDVEGVISNVNRAESDLNAFHAAQEKAGQAVLDAMKAKAEHDSNPQQNATDLATNEIPSGQPAPSELQDNPAPHESQTQTGLRPRFRHRRSDDAVVTVTIRNATPFTLYITFSSAQWQHIWPAEGRAFVAESGESVRISLRGSPGEPIFYKAWAAENPGFQWGNCDCDGGAQPSPIAICGDDDPLPLRLVQ